MDDSLSLTVSKRLRLIRKEAGHTLRTLSTMSGVSVNTISLIERGKTSPTIATVHKLAKALEVSLSDLLAEEASKQVVHTRRDQWQQERYGSVFVSHLGEGLRNQTMSPMLLTFEPRAESGAEPMVHAGHEWAFCLDGCIQYEIDGEKYRLESGDSIFFEAQLPHRWQNVNGASSQALMIVQSPNGSEL